MRDAQQTPPPQWNPSTTYSWKRKQIQAWIDAYGFHAFYDGLRYAIRSKHVMAGRYKVWFEAEGDV